MLPWLLATAECLALSNPDQDGAGPPCRGRNLTRDLLHQEVSPATAGARRPDFSKRGAGASSPSLETGNGRVSGPSWPRRSDNLSTNVALVIFLSSLLLSVIASLVLSASIERVGARLRFPEGLLGIVTALAADSPEISAAVAAMRSNHHDLGFGVILGSGVFNIAILLGLSVIVAGKITVDRRTVALDGSISFLVAGIVTALVFSVISPAATLILSTAVLLPYFAISGLYAEQLAGLGLPEGIEQLLVPLAEQVQRDARTGTTPRQAMWYDAGVVLVSLVCVVLASVGMVRAVQDLGPAWGMPEVLIGAVVLAAITGIPNAIAAIELGLHHRGPALVSEALNSNTIIVISGITIPIAIMGAHALAPGTRSTAGWLLGMTGLAVALGYWHKGYRRVDGILLIALYLTFVALLLW